MDENYLDKYIEILSAEGYYDMKILYKNFWQDVQKRMREFKEREIPYDEWRLIRKVNNSILSGTYKTPGGKVVKKLIEKGTGDN